jgi:hypothetical protein
MELARYVTGALCVGAVLLTILATIELRRMQTDSVQVLRGVGITRVDWWLRCIAGVYRLAFGQSRQCISTKRRMIFGALCVAYPLCALLLVLPQWDI